MKSTRRLRPAPVHEQSKQLTKILNTRISEQIWPPGHQFTWPQIAAEFGLDQYLVTAVLAPALRTLREAGTIETRPGVGSRVAVPGESWQPDEPPGPRYAYVEAMLRRRLAAGFYRPNSQFPSYVILAEELAVAHTTVKAACRGLTEQKILIIRFGNTTYVSPHLHEFSEEELLTPRKRRSAGLREPLSAFGEEKTLAEWAADGRCQVTHDRLYSRYVVLGWPLEKALGLRSRTAATPLGAT